MMYNMMTSFKNNKILQFGALMLPPECDATHAHLSDSTALQTLECVYVWGSTVVRLCYPIPLGGLRELSHTLRQLHLQQPNVSYYPAGLTAMYLGDAGPHSLGF